jgi:hypothetical protein
MHGTQNKKKLDSTLRNKLSAGLDKEINGKFKMYTRYLLLVKEMKILFRFAQTLSMI